MDRPDLDSELPDPGQLRNDTVALQLRERTTAVPERGWVPAYHFTVRLAESESGSGAAVGLISLRVGSTESLHLYAGHIGYAIDAAHRGHRYAAHALELVVPLARRLSIAPLWITVDPANHASRRTCELAGAEYVETVAIPASHEMYAAGARQRCRYRLG